MEENRSALDLAKNLLENGYKDVRFFDDLSYHPNVQQMITNQKLIDSNQIALMSTNQNPNQIINQNGYHNLAHQTINSGFQFQNGQNPHPMSTFPISSTSTGSSSSASTSSPFSASPQLLPPMDPNTYLHHMYAQAPPVQTIPNVTVMPMPTPMPMQKIQMSQLNHVLQALGSQAPVTPYRRKEEPLPEEIVNCRKCTAEINITRFSNLTNHARKHCELKTYQCPECTFSSDGEQKVAYHMKSTHKLLGDPLYRSHEQIETVLEKLAIECFPTYAEQLARVRAIHTDRLTRNGKVKLRKRKSLWDEAVMPQPTPILPVNPPPTKPTQPAVSLMSYHCYQCRKKIQCAIGTELSADGPLITHLRLHHTLECMPYKCGQCGYTSPVEWKIRRHIVVRHPEIAFKVAVNQLKSPNWKLFLTKFFAELPDILPDEQEDIECEKLEKKNMNPVFQSLISSINKKSIIDILIGFEKPIQMAIPTPPKKKKQRKNPNPIKITEIPKPPSPKPSEIQNPSGIQNFVKTFESKIQNLTTQDSEKTGIQNYSEILKKEPTPKIPKDSEVKAQNQNPPTRIQSPFWIQNFPLSSETKTHHQNPPKTSDSGAGAPGAQSSSGGAQESYWVENLPLSSESRLPEVQKSLLYVPIIDPNVITID